MTPTIVLVHGAYADSSSWDGLLGLLPADGRVIAFANPLRGLATDAALLTDLVRSLDGPVVLVGHSYGGAVMTGVPADAGDIVALVYVAGFALAPGESAGDASALVPGSTLGETLVSVPLVGRRHRHLHRPGQVPPPVLRRPACRAGGADGGHPATGHRRKRCSSPSGDQALWRSVPSWFVFGELDHNIPAGAHRIMAERAGARRAVEIPGASHVVGISHPDEVASLVRDALADRAAVAS